MEVSSEAETLFRLSDELLEFVDGFETYRDAWSCRDMDFLRDNLESAAVIGDGSSGPSSTCLLESMNSRREGLMMP